SYFGSAVLLDGQGTIALTSHQVKENPRTFVVFAVNHNFDLSENRQRLERGEPMWGYTEEIPVNITHVNRRMDVAFGRVPPELVEKYKLAPVTWGWLLGSPLNTICTASQPWRAIQ